MLVTHDQAVDRLCEARDRVTLAAVARAFVAGLTSAAPRYRTALVSFALAAHAEPHMRRPYGPKNPVCRECGVAPREEIDLDDRRAGLETGTTVPGEVVDAMVDLETFVALPAAHPTAEDWAALNGILVILAQAPLASRNTGLEATIHRERRALGLRGDKYVWRFLLETLSQIGALEVEGRPGLLRAWTPYHVRDERPGMRVEVSSPLAWWSRGHGVRREALAQVFGPHGPLQLPDGLAAVGDPPKRKA